MSYILEALKKADQERDLGAVPGLATPHEVERPAPRSFRWLWIVGALLSVNVVLLVLLLQGRDPQEPVAAQAPPNLALPPSSDQAPAPVRQSREVSMVRAPAPERTAPPESARAPSADDTAALPQPVNARSPEPSSRPEQDAGGRIDPVPAGRDASQLQSWYELPAEFRSRLTLPRLDMHVYSDEPQNRFVLVNLRKYREGERFESGLLLEEILPDGMVMAYRGERFFVEK